LFRAGEAAPARNNKLLNGAATIELQEDGVLPAVHDGRVSCYVRIHFWSEAGNGFAAIPV